MRPPITVPPMRIAQRFGIYFCLDCGFQVSPLKLCNCQPAPPPSVAQDGAAADDLAKRAREVKR